MKAGSGPGMIGNIGRGMARRRIRPVVEEMNLLSSEETVTGESGPMALALVEPVPSSPPEKPGIVARVRGWFALPKSEAA